MSTRTVSFSHRVNGTLTNATSVILSSPDASYGIKRNDTDAVVVSAGTPLTNTGTGTYSYTFTEPVAGLGYTGWVEWVYGGETYRVERLLAPVTSVAQWRYASQQDVEDLLGESNLRIISNVGDDDSTVDAARLQRAGEWADSYMDARFASLGYVTPLSNTSSATDVIVRDANARLTAWKLNQARLIASLVNKTPVEIAAIMEQHRREADSLFRDLSLRAMTLHAARLYSRGKKIEAHTGNRFLGWCRA